MSATQDQTATSGANGDYVATIGTVTLTKVGGTLKYHWGTGPSGEVSDAVLTRVSK